MHPHLEKAELPYVTACLNSMCQSVDQLLDVRKAQIDPLPCQRVYHMGGIPNESQPGPYIPASALRLSMLMRKSPPLSLQKTVALVFMQGCSEALRI